IEDLRQPLLGDPMSPLHAEGERVGCWQSAMLEDPAADGKVPVAVGVVKQAVAGKQDHAVQADADRERDGDRRYGRTTRFGSACRDRELPSGHVIEPTGLA